jgi:hypothetical protein
MTKQKTDREMLQACLEAMEISQRGGGSTNWEYMITDVRKHLQVEPAGSPLTDVGRVRLPDEPEAEFESCHFEGNPPAPYLSWQEWAASKPKKNVHIIGEMPVRAAATGSRCTHDALSIYRTITINIETGLIACSVCGDVGSI